MKKGLSILLLLIFLFNVGGYYIVYWGLRYQTDQQLIHRLNANLYEADETIELKIPIVLPYPIQSQDFERIDGSFEHKGEFFKLVKHKLKNDTLYIICIRDYETKNIVATIKDYVHLTQGLPGTSPSQKAMQFLSKLAKEYCSHSEIELLHEYGYTLLISFDERSEDLLQWTLTIDSPPPRS